MTIYRGVGGSGDSSTGEDVFGDNSSITSLNGISGAIQTPTYIKFAADANHTASQGELTWNTAEDTLDLGLNHGGVVLQIGQELHYRVTNQSGSNISDGTLVAFVGTTGNSGKLLVEPYDGTQASKTILGLTTETIINGENGYVTCFGKVRGIQTNGANYGETWADGDILYAAPTGGLTNVKPSAPDTKSTIAVVVNAHGSNGTLFVRPQISSNIGDDDLVELTTLSNGDILKYNSVSGIFENKPFTVTLGTETTGDYVASMTAGTGITVGTAAGEGSTPVITNTAPDQTVVLSAGTGISVTGTYPSFTITNTSSAGLADGDYGDITVSGSGSIWNIDAGVVSTTELGGDITTAGKALLDDASAADQRTTLGLGTAATTASTDYATAAQGALAASALQPGAIGTTVQAYDADLTTWAGKTAPTGDVVGTSDSQTLSNKTLTAPVISTISNTGTLTLPTSTDTLVGKATTDTLTNKTLTSPVLTTPTINSAQIPTISGTAPLYLCRAWVNFKGSGTVSIRGSGNVTSITDNGTGDYTVNFTTALPDANYCPNITRDSQSGVTGGILGIASTSGSPTLMSTTQLRFYTSNAATASLQDANILAVAVFR